MTSSRLHLESFETEAEQAARVVMTVEEAEEARLAAFEQGYSAGWEDCATTREAEDARLRSAVGQSVQQMSFTYHEARHHLLESLHPLVEAMMAKVLPVAARAALPQIVADQAQEIARGMTDIPLTVTANPSCIPAINDLMSDRAGLPLNFNADPDLTEGQAYLKFSDGETRIDLDEVIAKISSAIDSYFSANPEETSHG